MQVRPGYMGSAPDGSTPVTFWVILPRCFTMAWSSPRQGPVLGIVASLRGPVANSFIR